MQSPDQVSTPVSEHAAARAAVPRIPEPTLEQQRAIAEHRSYLRRRGELERASILRGLVWLAVVALLFSVWRAGLERVFVPGWWHR